jgi:putative ABC transport system permease protein
MMTALYRWLLRSYPPTFRVRFGHELVEAFDAGLRASRTRGLIPTVAFIVTRLADVVGSGIAERRAERRAPPSPGHSAGFDSGVARAWLQDLRLATRAMHRQPGASLVIIATLAVGIGANTTVFSVLDVVLLRPLPYRDADRLVRVHTDNDPLKISGGPASHPDFIDWRAADVFEDVGIYQLGNSVIRTGHASDRVPSAAASASLFSTLGVQPVIGRLPSAAEDRPGKQPVVLLTEAIWRHRFGSDPGILARPVIIDGKPLTVVGVLPASFVFQTDPEFWTTFEDDGDVSTRANRYLNVIARMRLGVPAAQVNERLRAICFQLERAYPDSNKGWRASVVPWQESEVSESRPQLVLLSGSVGLVLLIGCSNVAMLLLVQGARRSRELAVRAALGAGRRRIVSQLLTESLVLSLVGGAVGVGLAAWWVSLIAQFGPRNIPRLADTAISERVLLFALAASCASAVLFGVVPALRSSRPDVSALLQDAARTATPGRRRRTLSHALLIGETAISLLLVVWSALLVKSFVSLVNADAGFRIDHLLTFHLPMPTAKFLVGDQYQRDRVQQYFENVVAHLEARPDVESAAATLELPLAGGGYRVWQGFEITGHPQTGRQKTLAVSNNVTPSFFTTLQMPVLAGRRLTARDDRAAPPVTVVSEAFARTFLPGENPLGQHIRFESDTRQWEIVGVVGDLRPDGLDSKPNPTVYKPFAQDPKPFMAIVVRTRTDPAALGASLTSELLAIDQDVPPYRVRPAEDLVAQSLSARRFATVLMATFAAAALTLALVGLYAVVSHLVTQRTPEIGLRVALGASRAGVLGSVLRQALGPSCIGLSVGVVTAILAAPAIQRFLYGVEPLDPVVLLLVPVALLGACIIASLVPAHRAVRIDPLVALRTE